MQSSYLPFRVDFAPEKDHPATDFQIDLIKMPDRGLGRRFRNSAAMIGPK
jgi:hypothetical protein